MKGKLLILISALFWFVVRSSFAETAEFEGRYWMANLEGKVSVTTDTALGTDIDLENDLGISDENFPEARMSWYPTEKSQIRLSYTQVGYDATKVLDKTVTFSGKTYTSGTTVNTSIDVKYARLAWLWQLLSVGDDNLKISPLIEAKGFEVESSLDAPAVSLSESKKFLGGLPTVGVAFEAHLIKSVSLFAEVSGIAAGNYGHMIDAEGGIKITPLPHFSLMGGYRVFDLKVEINDDRGDLQLTGPFAGGQLRF